MNEAATMRCLPQEAVASWPDLFNTMRRLSGRLEAVAHRLTVLEAQTMRRPSGACAARPAATRAAITAGLFGPAPRVARERTRTITSSKGRLVRVLEKPSRQLELML